MYTPHPFRPARDQIRGRASTSPPVGRGPTDGERAVTVGHVRTGQVAGGIPPLPGVPVTGASGKAPAASGCCSWAQVRKRAGLVGGREQLGRHDWQGLRAARGSCEGSRRRWPARGRLSGCGDVGCRPRASARAPTKGDAGLGERALRLCLLPSPPLLTFRTTKNNNPSAPPNSPTSSPTTPVSSSFHLSFPASPAIPASGAPPPRLCEIPMSAPSALQASAGLRRLAGASAAASTSTAWATASPEGHTAATDLQQLQRAQAHKRRRVERAGQGRERPAGSVGVGKASAPATTEAAGQPGTQCKRTEFGFDKVVVGGEPPSGWAGSARTEAGAARGPSPNSSPAATNNKPVKLTTPRPTTSTTETRWRTPRVPTSLLSSQLPPLGTLAGRVSQRHFSLFRSTPPAKEASPQPQPNSPTPTPSTEPTTNLSGLDKPAPAIEPTPAPPPPPRDELNTLLRHPTLYNPLMKPKNPLILCHGTKACLDHQSAAPIRDDALTDGLAWQPDFVQGCTGSTSGDRAGSGCRTGTTCSRS